MGFSQPKRGFGFFLFIFYFLFSLLKVNLNSNLIQTFCGSSLQLYLCNKNTNSEDIHLYILFIYFFHIPSLFSYFQTLISI
jgi:hypothetical protein